MTDNARLLTDNFRSLVGNGPVNCAWHILFLTLTCGVIAAGVMQGIERLSKYLLPTLFVLMIFSLPGRSRCPARWKALPFSLSLIPLP